MVKPSATSDGKPRPNTGGVAADQLRSFIERVERLAEEKATLTEDIREVFAEAKMTGFDTKAMRQLIKLRKMESASREEQAEILKLYAHALGMDEGVFL